MQIKICGLTRIEDVHLAIDLGSNYIGFVMHPHSQRYCAPSTLKQILKSVDSNVQVALVFGYDGINYIQNIANEYLSDNCFLQVPAQHNNFHDVTKLYGSKKIIVSYSVYSPITDNTLEAYKKYQAIILDTHSSSMAGGTGKTFPWEFVKGLSIDFFLAGGLTPDNIEQGIHTLNPFGLDVASGIEEKIGEKDKNKMFAFFFVASALSA